MASTAAAATMALSPPYAAPDAFFKPLPATTFRASASSKRPAPKFQVRASLKEKAVTGLTAAALTASLIVPDVAEAAVSPSLKNFLLSIVAGGVVAAVITGAVVAVANFDPVKRT